MRLANVTRTKLGSQERGGGRLREEGGCGSWVLQNLVRRIVPEAPAGAGSAPAGASLLECLGRDLESSTTVSHL